MVALVFQGVGIIFFALVIAFAVYSAVNDIINF